MIKALTFDLWFTLIWDDSVLEEYYRASKLNVIYRSLKNFSINEIDSAMKRVKEERGEYIALSNLNEWVRLILLNLGYEADGNFVKELAMKISFAGFDRHPYLNSEAREVLGYFKEKGYKLGLISNVNRYGLAYRKLLTELKLINYFDSLIFSSDVGSAKPDRLIFDYSLKELKVNDYEVIHIGDSYEHDILGALNSGIKAILYMGLWDKFEEARKVKRENSNYNLKAESLKECIKIVESFNP
ncbi:MAG: HAD family hydrolase [Nitrososphaerales archaeon]